MLTHFEQAVLNCFYFTGSISLRVDDIQAILEYDSKQSALEIIGACNSLQENGLITYIDGEFRLVTIREVACRKLLDKS